MQSGSNNYDYLIVGAGAAGLLLALEIVQNPALRDKQILLVDPHLQKGDDRTWCFWEKPEHDLHSIVSHRWPSLAFQGSLHSRQDFLGNWTYQMIRGIDFYQHAFQALQQSGQVTWLEGKVENHWEATENGWVNIRVGMSIYQGRWLFDSRLPSTKELQTATYQLWQNFQGWHIRTNKPVFDPQTATLMDFRVEQSKGCNFFYVLPFSEREALVEATYFSSQTQSPEHFQNRLQDYCENQLKLEEFDILKVEEGAIPMTDYPFKKKVGARTIKIGTAGGQVKPTTGYAFQNMRQDAKQMVQHLVKNGDPFYPIVKKPRYQFYDRLLLHILQEMPQAGKGIFERLFRYNSARSVLQFMSEDSSFPREVLLLASLPWRPFLMALYQQKFTATRRPTIPIPTVTVPNRILSTEKTQTYGMDR
jgi:lycopene beta-cyclase